MKVRRHLFLQNSQRVASSRVVLYWMLAQASRPMKLLTRPLSQRRPASSAAPMAPASPQCSCTITSAGVSLPLKRDSMKSTCAFRSDAAVIPEASGFERGANGPGFATMLVHNHVGRRVLALEARFDEIHLRFHGGQVVLRAALQQEARADGGEIGNLRNVQPDVLGQHVAEARHDLFRLPALPLEVHNVALHE